MSTSGPIPRVHDKTPDHDGGIPMLDMNRRDFLKTSAFLGTTAALSGGISGVFALGRRRGDALGRLEEGESAFPGADARHVIYSQCLNCHT
ncbi:MAG: twin-arginine translocation signal domain-containing protein, partial [Chloroflexi bacterium]